MENQENPQNFNKHSMKEHITAKDFFLHLGAIVALYVVIGNFINLLFRIINKSFPEINQFYSGFSNISLPVATLIIVFPIFILLSWLIQKTYQENPNKRQLGIRKWLTYITLFFAGIFLVGDMVTVLYKFLDGQDMTAGFIFKALTVLLVSGCVFIFYLQDIREKINHKKRKFWTYIISILIVVSIILGFGILGSPRDQRLLRLDNQKISDLQNLEWQAINNWQSYGALPESLDTLIDPQNKNFYQYKKTGNLNFELCAKFNFESDSSLNKNIRVRSLAPIKADSDWSHPSGQYCFERKIDPNRYPLRAR